MKKIFAILLCGIIVLSITGCENNKNDFEVGKESDIKILKSDVSLSVKEGTLTDTGATFILKNNSSRTLEYGEPYEIEIKKDNTWYKIDVELSFILPAYSLKYNEEKEIKINWEYGYGKLAKGDYRLVKEISYKLFDDKYEEIYVAAEFTIE